MARRKKEQTLEEYYQESVIYFVKKISNKAMLSALLQVAELYARQDNENN